MPKELKRGEIYWINWNPSRGSEQSGIRPALIIQNDVGNKYGATTIVASLTTTVKKTYPFLVKITSAESGLTEDNTIDCASIMTIDKSRVGDKCGELAETKMTEVSDAIRVSLGL